MDKPEGKDAIPGLLVLGTKESAIISLKQNEQIDDSSNVRLFTPDGTPLPGNLVTRTYWHNAATNK